MLVVVFKKDEIYTTMAKFVFGWTSEANKKFQEN